MHAREMSARARPSTMTPGSHSTTRGKAQKSTQKRPTKTTQTCTSHKAGLMKICMSKGDSSPYFCWRSVEEIEAGKNHPLLTRGCQETPLTSGNNSNTRHLPGGARTGTRMREETEMERKILEMRVDARKCCPFLPLSMSWTWKRKRR